MSDRTSVLTHGKGEDSQEGPTLKEILPLGSETFTHSSSDPARGELHVHEFGPSALTSKYEEVLGEKNRK